jgi:mannose-1-phosphate guanylyltransferase/mannose-6-phosphate isomerase
MTSTIVPVLLSGGEGKRLWPLSSSDRPKQFLKLNSTKYTLFQFAAKRALLLAKPQNVITVTSQSYAQTTRKQLDEIDYELKENVILEPCSKNTAAALALAAHHARERFENPILWVLPTDHAIDDDQKLADTAQKLLPFVIEHDYIATFGVRPTRSDNHYGHIIADQELVPGSGVFKASTFVEKPKGDLLNWVARQDNCFWNSGMFLMKAETLLSELAVRDELTYKLSSISYAKSTSSALGITLDALLYEAMPSLPIDKVIMEECKKLIVTPVDIGWSDIGSWYSLWEMSQKEGRGESLENFLTKIARV